MQFVYCSVMSLLAVFTIVAVNPAAGQPVKAAQAFRMNGEPVQPAPDGTYFCEAEEFRVIKPATAQQRGWKAQPWGENYYAGTFANTFLSRKAFLGAPENCGETVATINVDVKEAGNYLAMARYEAAYRFETQFRIKIEQNSRVVFDQLYGSRDNVKIWAFRNKLKTEVAWSWGAVENVVWEGYLGDGKSHYATLQPGPATITLIAGKQPRPQAKRNVDLVMLTRDEEQIKTRIEKEGYLPLDGMLTQAGDVYMRIQNTGATNVSVRSLQFFGGPMQQHSPYWVHIRNWQSITAEVEPGRSSDWIDVGGTMDTLNDGQWGFNASSQCKIEFGVKNAAGQIKSVRIFDANGDLQLVSWADARYGAKFQTPAEATQDLFDYLKRLPLHGKKIELTRVNASGSMPKDIFDFYGLNQAINGAGVQKDCRGLSLAQIQETYGDKMSEADRKSILIMSLGDEIGLPEPDAEDVSAGFVAFLKAQGLTPGQVDAAAGDDWGKVSYDADTNLRNANPSLYYWSKRYLYHYGIRTIKEQTDLLRKLLPNAHIGANFSPHHGEGEYTFLGETFKWVTCFREGGMTLPWSEDYIWQVPVGTPQMNGISLDLFRAGQRGKPDRKTLYYVMPHSPGNIPDMWRRLWHNAIGHGATVLDLFLFEPVWLAYTENHVTGKEMYAEVLRSMRELGLYEDIIQTGVRRPAQTALWFSETGDIWRDNLPSFGAAKRALYVAILHQQAPLDFVVEQDTADGTLANYRTLYLADNHVSRAASAKIAEWVRNGGTLFATAGAGMFDEYNQPNTVLRELMGVEQTELVKPDSQQVHFIKQDLRFVKPIDEVTLAKPMAKFPVFGAVSKFRPAAGVKISGTFSDGSPAVTTRKVGTGQVTYCAFLPGLSYFYPAIPLKPLDRGSTKDAMSHFVPTAFDQNASALIGSAVVSIDRPVQCSKPLVASSMIESKTGTAIVLENWTGKPVKNLVVTVDVPVPGASAELASGAPVKVRKTGAKTIFTLGLDAADTLILR
jgi:hypothetical protein